MIRFGVRVDGLTDAKAALASLPEAFRSVVAETIETGAAVIEFDALARVPYDEGDLFDSIGTNIREDGLQAAVGAGDFKARFVEFGTDDTPAQPFLFPAFKKGARYVRQQMKGWGEKAGQRVRTKTRRGKRANAGTAAPT